MRSFTVATCMVVGVCGRVLQVPPPVITPAPKLEERQLPDALSFAGVLLTAVPEWLREIAATDLPAVSSILSSEFTGGERPEWFLELPSDIQSYLVSRFGPPTATEPAASGSATAAPSSNQAKSTQASETSAAGESSTAQSTQTQASNSPSQSQSSSQTPSQSTDSTSAASSTGSASTGSRSSVLSKATSSSTSTRPSSSVTVDPIAPADTSNNGLSRAQKIGIGLGVPFALLGVAALALVCCTLLRRRRKRSINGSIPPSSPGFIPRFAFQEKNMHDPEQRQALNRSSSSSLGDLPNRNWDNSNWDDDVMEPTTPMENQPPAMTYQPLNQQPIVAPALYHTHSSNRARGRRTSYTSLSSVAEVSEPDSSEAADRTRQTPPRMSPRRLSNRYSPPRSLVPPPVPVPAIVKRKPVPSYPSGSNPAADMASQSLLRQTMPEHANYGSNSSRYGNKTHITALAEPSPAPYVSPIDERNSQNPFSNQHGYVEDYGPEYQHQDSASYISDIENGLYGGHTDLSRYPMDNSPRSSKTEWPLRSEKRHKRTRSPMWDRVYEG